MKNYRFPDTNDELYVYRYHQGMKLVKPDEIDDNHATSVYTIKRILDLPFCVYFLDRNSRHRNLNEHSAAICGFSSITNGVGKSIAENLTLKSAERILNNDIEVVKSNLIKIAEEPGSYKNNNSFEGLAIKMPLYNNNNDCIGIFGCSIVYATHSIPDFIKHVTLLGLLGSNKNTIHLLSNIGGIYITRRERDVLKHSLQGKSASAVGHILHLSRKTVEFHLDNLKFKFGCSSKAEFIETVLSYLIDIS